MLGDVYTVKYLETFRRELDEAADYIAFELENVTAADKLLADVEAAIERTSTAPTVTKPYGTDAGTGDVYYRIGVRNFSIFYVVIGSVMEVRWFRYSPSQQPLVENPTYLTLSAPFRRETDLSPKDWRKAR